MRSVIVLILFLLLVLSILVMLVGGRQRDGETSYECGFESLNDVKNSFEIRFYLIGVLFIIFDIESIVIISYGVCMENVGVLGVYCIGEFMLELGLSVVLIYRYKIMNSV